VGAASRREIEAGADSAIAASAATAGSLSHNYSFFIKRRALGANTSFEAA
jgi:hypothetical protein